MNHRERYVAALTFGQPDRVPLQPGHGRKSTRDRWEREGLTKGADAVACAAQQIGLPAEAIAPAPPCGTGVDFRMIPHFEEKVIERRANSQVVQDWKGNICEIGLEFDVVYLRQAIDFCTRSWIKCPVESRGDWQQMKQRYAMDAPGRFPADLAERGRKLADRTVPSGLSFSGPFWQLREWLGFEGLCMLLLDDPAFAQEMIDFWEQFVVDVLERTFEHHVPDYVLVNEDMAYKEKPMIGPAQSEQFLFRCWRRWADLCRDAGVPIFEVDSDGHVGQLIPVWIEAGFICNSPQEVAAGNDLPAYRKQYGRTMAYRGGVDKRAMAGGGKVLRNEMERLRPVVEAGGFIPSCDHGIPSDVSWANFLDYLGQLAEMTGWRTRVG